MSQHHDDATLGDPTPPPAPHPFGNPDGQADLDLPAPQAWSVDQILAMARTPEKRARICLRADLQARHDQILAELRTLITAAGEIIEDPERSNGDVSNESRAIALNTELTQIQREMAASMWQPLFRGKTSDDMAVFNKAHFPKADGKGNVDLKEYYFLLISECSVEPKLSVDDVRKLKGTLGAAAYAELRDTAKDVCTEGGVDVPKSPVSLRNLTRQSPAS
jgi:hypothetical protein